MLKVNNRLQLISKVAVRILVIGSLSFSLVACSSSKRNLNDPNNPNGLSESDLNYGREKRFGEGGIPMAEGEGMFRDIRFDYDSSMVSGQAKQDLDYNVGVLNNNPNVNVQVEGHCDERGTVEYNLSLGDKRAKAVYESLVSMGIAPSRLTTISYGEELPLDNSGTEDAFAKNRRAHFSAFTK